MDDGGLALAFGAGLVAAVNPCGFALLPAYLSVLLLADRPGRATAVARALRASAALTAGFAGVFLLFGLAVAPVASSVQRFLPAFTVLLGLLVAAAGVRVLAGRPLPAVRLPGVGRGPVTASLGSMAGFGASYAVASLGCTIAPFLAVVVTAFRAGSTVDGLALFLAYSIGMGLVVATAAVAVALARSGSLAPVRRLGPALARVGGGVLLAAGAYVAWYGAWELRVLHGDAGADPLVDAAGTVQRSLAALVGELGGAGFATVLAVLLATAGCVVAIRRRRAGVRRSSAAGARPTAERHRARLDEG